MTDSRPLSLFHPHIAAEAIERVRAVLESGRVGEGDVVGNPKRHSLTWLGSRPGSG